MAQFIAFDQNVEVNRQTVLSIVNALDRGKETRIEILKKNGINPESGEWFSQQAWLNAFKEIANSLGDMNLFMIGKAIIENAEFPPMKNLEEALQSIDIAYHMNHRLDGKIMFAPQSGKMIEGIGHYHLKSFDEKSKSAVMVCDNPYPSKFDEGIITQIVRKFKPVGSRENVALDLTKDSRVNGGESCTYIIHW